MIGGAIPRGRDELNEGPSVELLSGGQEIRHERRQPRLAPAALREPFVDMVRGHASTMPGARLDPKRKRLRGSGSGQPANPIQAPTQLSAKATGEKAMAKTTLTGASMPMNTITKTIARAEAIAGSSTLRVPEARANR